MIRTLTALTLALLASCTGPGRGWVRADVVGPSVEALAPYTQAGIGSAQGLTIAQQAALRQELEILLGVLSDVSAASREALSPAD